MNKIEQCENVYILVEIFRVIVKIEQKAHGIHCSTVTLI